MKFLFLKSYFDKRDYIENEPVHKNKDKKKIDMNYLTQSLLTWSVGCIVSLMPVFTDSYVNFNFERLFACKDLFLVLTTLIISTLFSMIFDENKGILKNVAISIGILLACISLHLSSLLQRQANIPYISYVGICLFLSCLSCTIVSYFIISKKRD